jgi:sugar lactone lactonase YvrE
MKFWKQILFISAIALLFLSSAVYSQTRSAALPKEEITGKIEPVATFTGAMPTGVTVSQTGRIFVNFPKWGDRVEYTVAEIKNGRSVPYPNAQINRPNPKDPTKVLVSVQSVVVDPSDRLWILDTGSINFQPAPPGGFGSRGRCR